MQQKIQKAYSFQGYLEKKSPAMFKGWQQRYFIMRDSGNMLLYYSKDPKSSDQKPKGIIPIRGIQQLKPGGKNELTIIMEDRQVLLRAKEESVRNEWYETLNFIKELKAKEDKEGNTSNTEKHKLDWSDLDNDTMNRIKLEEESLEYQKVEDQISYQNDEVLKAKGIYPYLVKFDQEVIDRHVICGFLLKKGKLAQLTVAKKRWFFMITSVSLNDDNDDNPPTQNDLPSVFKFDHIYYFAYDQKGDESKNIGKIIVDNCEKAELMALEKNQIFEAIQIQKLPYGLKLHDKKEDREYMLFSEHLTEVNKWINGINRVLSRPPEKRQSLGKDGKPEEEPKEEVIFSQQVDKKHQNKLLTGPLSWKKVILELKTNSIEWNEVGDDDDNDYLLLIKVVKVEGGNKSWVIFTKEGEEFKFRANSIEDKDKWVKLIQEQAEKMRENLEIEVLEKQDEIEESQLEKKKTLKSKTKEQEEESEDEEEDALTQSYYKRMALNVEKIEKGEEIKNGPKKSFFGRLFYCCGGRNHDDDDDTDRGF